MQKFLTYTRVALTLFVVLFVMSWQRLGPPNVERIVWIIAICLAFVAIIHVVLLAVDASLRLVRWLAHWGRDRPGIDQSGALTGRYTVLFRVILPVALVALVGSVSAAAEQNILLGPHGTVQDMLATFALFLATALALFAAAHLISFRYRVDPDGLVISRFMIVQASHRWSDLTAVGTGPVAGDIVLVFRDGQFARIPRYCEGHDAVVEYALSRMNHA